MVFHLFQADQFNRSIAGGVIRPQWTISSNAGFGSPNFIFYAPAGYYLASLLHSVIPSTIISVILAIWSSFFFSGISMFLAVKKLFGREGSLLSAILYQLLPFHLLNLYTRGAYSELCAYVWYPLIIMFLYETLTNRNSFIAHAGLSLSYAGLILTHLVSGFMFAFVTLFFVGYNFFFGRYRKASLTAAVSLLIGLGVSSYYLLPVIFERKFVQIGYIFTYVFSDYRSNFLFSSNNWLTRPSHFNFVLHLTVVVETILFVVLLVLVSRRNRGTDQKFAITALSCIFIAAFFLTTPLSAPLWAVNPSFAALQFPWRWVSVMELSLCFLVGAAFCEEGLLRVLPAGTLARTAVYSVITLSVLSQILIIKNSEVHSQKFLDSILDPEQVAHYRNLPKEYTPIWATNLEELLGEENAEKVSLLSGRAEHHVFEWLPEKRVVSVKALTPVLLRIRTFYYPGWEAEVDERKTGITVEKPTGAILINVPQGDHTVKLYFGETPLRVFSGYLSLGSWVMLAVYVLISRKNVRLKYPEDQVV
ncbi:MAG TPA: 6-pyruvoyl-tetrahydropterin synthase-related protein [Geobacteraceae bacterium]|nr:6-pyruvoyl-tetrahydropterin synthase-related protein [Geobacteraceae bacterium]